MNEEQKPDASAPLTLADASARESVLDYLFTLEREFDLLLLRNGQPNRAKSRGRH